VQMDFYFLQSVQLNFTIGQKEVMGVVKTIDDAGKLVIFTDNQIKRFSSGEVTKVELT
ncbi:hypothetical protein ERJ61_10195, partial [Lactobacillus helveticus]|nr:hypothetical protein [Lactobacillus helveticus]